MFKTLNYLYLEEDPNVMGAYEVYCSSLDTEEFCETVRLIEQLNFFLHRSDFADIESLDKEAELAHLIIFLLRSTSLHTNHIKALEKVG